MTRLKAWMVASYPNQEADADTQKCWTADWTEVILTYGIDALVEALTRHRKDSNFLPLAHDLNVQVAAIKRERAIAGEEKSAQHHMSELESWKRQCRAEGTEWVHPDLLMKQLEQDVFMMRDTVEVAFGENWRDHPLMREKDNKGAFRYGLAEMFALAVRP